MNSIKRTFGFVCRTLLLVVMASAMAVSCSDKELDDLKEKLELLTDKVFELEERLNSEISALKEMMEGKILITEVSTDVASGITTVKLSNGETLQLLPEKDLESFLTYFENAAGKHWAYIDEDGKVVPFYDEEGGLIPIESSFPKVIEKDGETYIVIGGKEYPMSGNSVFSDYELISDPLTGEVYAVTFTFGEDMSFTVTVDGACGFYFVQAAGWATEVIDNHYVENGRTERVQIDARGVVDYVLQIPDGWRVKEYEDVYMGTRFFDITAPSDKLVEDGVAAAEGELKVVAVLEGGKATVAKLYLSSEPFQTFEVSLGKAYVKMYNGLQKFVYGMCLASEYDEAAVFETASGLLTAYDYPAGYNISDMDIVGEDVAGLLDVDAVAGSEYVFWAMPALYYMTDEEAGYYLEEGVIEKVQFKYNSITFDVSKPSFRDALLTMDLVGVDAYYTGLLPKEEYMLEDILYSLNNAYYTPQTEPMTYEGSVFLFADVEPQSDMEYVAWFAIAEAGKTYSASDVVVCEFTTSDLAPGSDVTVTAGTPVPSPLDVTVELAATDAETIYYSFLTSKDAASYTDDAAKAAYLFENGLFSDAETVTVKASETISKVRPETDYVLFAVATDAEGKYGAVLSLECRTTEIQYNSMTVNLALKLNDPGNVILTVSSTGGEADGYLYWIGKTSDNTWKSSNFLGGSAEMAQEYMFLNADAGRFATVAENYPIVDGEITLTDLSAKVEYVIVAMAKDKDGGYSKASEFKFTTRAVAIGNVVLSSDSKWADAKPTVEWLEKYFIAANAMMDGAFGFNITVPSGFTAYVLAGTEAYLTEGDPTVELSVEDRIIKIIEWVDTPRDWNTTVGDDWIYPYKDCYFYHNEHGAPLYGNAVIWASQEYHDSVCDCGGNYVEKKTLQGYEVDFQHLIEINDGSPVEFRQPRAIGSKESVVDKVFVVCQDLEGNCYESFVFDVPVELFQNAGSRDE